MWGAYGLSVPTVYIFVTLFFLTFVLCMPKRALSPLTMFYVYYGAWFVIAPLFASKYRHDVLYIAEYQLSFAFVYTVFGLGIIAIEAGRIVGERLTTCEIKSAYDPDNLRKWILPLYLFSTLMIALIVAFSGGWGKWIADPGTAFLNRGGTGVYVILSHFSSIILAAISGYYAYCASRKWPVLMFLLWLIVTSPVHGSKLQISLLALLLFLPWLRNVKLWSIWSFCLYGAFVLLFLLGMMFRGSTLYDVTYGFVHILSYFTALENLALSIRDFSPGFLTTFFLPFVKFLTPFGLEHPKMYFDMNHMLTDHYYPDRWAIRATEQWPVETDLYLNFFFFGGLPLVAAYLFFVAWVYGYGRRTDSLGAWLASALLIVGIISHLRGSLYNHIDFYMYPYIFSVYFIFRKYSFPLRHGSK
jgi:hypothetical protein